MLNVMQIMSKQQGETVVRGAGDNIIEVLDITGLIDDLKI